MARWTHVARAGAGAALLLQVVMACGDGDTPPDGEGGEAGSDGGGGMAGAAAGAGSGRGGVGGTGNDAGASGEAGEAGEAGGGAGGDDTAGTGGRGGGAAGGTAGNGATGGGGTQGGSGVTGGTNGTQGGSAGNGQGGDGGAGDGGAGDGGAGDGGAGDGGGGPDECGAGAPIGSCPCARVSAEGDDAAALASDGATPFLNVQSAIDFAAAHATIKSVCLAQGAHPGPLAGDLTLKDGVSLYGRYETSGWTRTGANSRLEPATASGVVFGPDIAVGARLDGIDVRPAATAVTAGISVDGARGVELDDVWVLPIPSGSAGNVTHQVGLDVRNGASVSHQGGGVSIAGYLVQGVGVRSIGSEIVVENGEIAVAGAQEPVGVWLEDSPGSRVSASVTVERFGSPGDAGSATGIRVAGDGQGVSIDAVVQVLTGFEIVGIDILGCAGQAPSIGANIVVDGRDSDATLLVGVRSRGDCNPEISAGVDVFGGSFSPRSFTMTGIDCDGGCKVRGSSVTTYAASVMPGSRVRATGVVCLGCAEVVQSSIVGLGQIISCYRNCEYTAIGLRVRGGLVDRNNISAGVGGGPIGIDSGYLYGVIASGTTRIQNNVIYGGRPAPSLGSAARTHGISLTGPVEVHSNSINGGDPNTSACGSPGIWLAGSNTAIIRNNSIRSGVCGAPVEESGAGNTTPAIAENNDFDDTGVLWRDWEGDNPTTAAELNAMPDLTVSGNFVGHCGTLSPASPCVNTGTSAGAPAHDYYGNPRDDGYPDVGAVEYVP